MKKICYLFLAVLLVATSLTAGCGNGEQGTFKLVRNLFVSAAHPSKPSHDDGTLHIVTSFYPMYIATANITKGVDGVQVINMTKPQTGCLHDYQLTTDDMKTLEDADIFVANGAGMESFLDKVIKEHKNLKLIDASKDIELLENDGETNPHVWLDVDNAIRQVDNICQQLSDADPEHAGEYHGNALVYTAKLKELQGEMNNELIDISHHDIVTFHEAFPYFAKEFNLNIIKVVEREPGTEPTPKELETLINEVSLLPSKVIFTEPQYSPAAAKTIAAETGAKIFTLDPIVTGDADADALDAYIDKMRQNAKTLKEALK